MTEIAVASRPPAARLAEGVTAYLAGEHQQAFAVFSDLAPDNAEAQAWLGSLYANGHGVGASLELALHWYLKAAEAGHVPSQTNVGAMLVMGQGVAADAVAGAAWLRRAAESDDAYAQFNYGSLLSKGQGVQKDEAAAMHWYERSACGGHYPAQARLGFNFAHGVGGVKDRIRAFAWLSLASGHGVGSALKALEGVVGNMSSEEKRDGFAMLDHLRHRLSGYMGAQRLNPIPG